jgi:SAM-dependent methyltransferase
MSRRVPVDVDQEVESSRRYFSSFAADYHRAFEGGGRDPIHHLINRLFRRKTFQRRTDVIEGLLEHYGLTGKHVVDLGCGSGEVSLVAARLGATVTGLDIVPEMVEIARQAAGAAELSDRATFRVHDVVRDAMPAADIAMMVGVIEYYGDLEPILAKVCGATRERLIICDTRGPWWRRTLRYGLARLKRFYLHYHSPDTVAAIARRQGMTEEARIAGHSFTVMVFRRS